MPRVSAFVWASKIDSRCRTELADSARKMKAPFKEGDEVHTGDLLFEIDPRTYEADRNQAEANLKLSERKLIERAKGLLMKSRGLDEEAAFAFMRKSAMDRKLKLAELAQRVVDAAELISGA